MYKPRLFNKQEKNKQNTNIKLYYKVKNCMIVSAVIVKDIIVNLKKKVGDECSCCAMESNVVSGK